MISMLDKSVYTKRDELCNKSKSLRNLSLDEKLNFNEFLKIRENQSKIYKKWLFYDKLTKELNKKEPTK